MPRRRKAPRKGARADRRFLKDPRTKFRPELIPVIKNLVKKGETDFRIAEALDVCMSTLSYWKLKFPKLARAMVRAEELLVKQTEATHWQRANGWSHEAEEIGYYRGKAIRTKVVKIYPPDVSAAKMMLGAARPEKYRDKLDVDVTSRPVQFVIKGLEEEVKGAAPSEPRASENQGSAVRV